MDDAAVPWRRTPQGRCILVAALLLLVVVGPIVQEYTAQPASRYPFTAAMVEDGTVSLEAYADIDNLVLIDRLEVDGELYSDKAPGQPVLAIPAYVVAQLLGAEPATVFRANGNLGVWAVTVWTSVLPAIAILILMGWAVRDLPSPASVLGPMSLSFSTLLLPFAAEMYGHLLAGMLGLAAWLVVRGEGDVPAGRAVAAGALCGAAVVVEYQAALFILPIAALVASRSVRRLVPFALVGIPFAAALLAYQWRVLGNPFESSYSGKTVHEGASPLVTGFPDPVQAGEMLVGSRGLLLFTPFVGLAAAGLLVGYRRGVIGRSDAFVCGSVAALFFLLQAGWSNPWGGDMPGPRYLIPALPFLVLGATVAWQRWPRWAGVLTVVGVVTMTFPLITRHLVSDRGWTVGSQLSSLEDQGVMPTIFTMAVGPLGWILHLGLVGLVARWLVRELRQTSGPVPTAERVAA